jgi:glycosyltransferase involved in cell wall biosynthesis
MSNEESLTRHAREGAKPGKPKVLTFTGYFIPGFKSGGILRNIINTTDNLCEEFEFWIVTRDRDLGDKKPYTGIVSDVWQQVGNAMVYYLSPNACSLGGLNRLIRSTQHDVIYLNSYFEPLTIKVLLNRRFRWRKFKPVIVAPFGEFAWASLGQKYPRKLIFMRIASLVGLYRDVMWRVSSDFEAADLRNVLKVKTEAIHVTGDLPIKGASQGAFPTSESIGNGGLRVVFLSRISREKNLDFALKVLSKVHARIQFDIYGPAENSLYWEECRKLIARLPQNVSVTYLGSVNPGEVLQVFSRYDLFLFPTGGEAYGNTIAECLIAGTPVLISTATPWRELQADLLGWDLDLNRLESFAEVIDEYAQTSSGQRAERRATVKRNIAKRLSDPEILESNRRLFLKQLPS